MNQEFHENQDKQASRELTDEELREIVRDRIWRNPAEYVVIEGHICTTCKHWRGEWTCDAYPHGIPRDIRQVRFIHFEHYPGDNGITYEPT